MRVRNVRVWTYIHIFEPKLVSLFSMTMVNVCTMNMYNMTGEIISAEKYVKVHFSTFMIFTIFRARFWPQSVDIPEIYIFDHCP